jgi:hypothetical protein
MDSIRHAAHHPDYEPHLVVDHRAATGFLVDSAASYRQPDRGQEPVPNDSALNP